MLQILITIIVIIAYLLVVLRTTLSIRIKKRSVESTDTEFYSKEYFIIYKAFCSVLLLVFPNIQ